jgi:ferredoxin-NADP reductase
MIAVFVRREELAPGIWQCFLVPERPLQYVAGQYLEIRLDDISNDPRGPGRTMTLTSLPSESEISFVYRFDLPASPHKQKMHSMQPGTRVYLGDVMGDLVLPKLPSVPLVYVAGGIGMASFTGMMRELQQNNETRTVHLFYSLRSEHDDAFRKQVDTFPFTSRQRFIRPNYLNADDVAKVTTDDSLVYISGSERFVIGLRNSLHALGYGHQQIIFDFFDGYKEL